jgi:hypothetical protein
MRNLFRFAMTALLAAALSACTTEQMSRNLYEGVRAHNESFKSTPMESKSELPSYDEYDKARRGAATGHSQ